MMRLLVRWVAAGWVAAVALDARAGVDADLSEIDANVASLARTSGDLDRRLASAGRGFLAGDAAVLRFEDCVFADMIGEHQRAAEGFFALVSSGALDGTPLQADAEFSFAESLRAMGNLETAESRYLLIAESPNHPFRSESVRRLLELYADSGRSDAFYRWFESEILRGKVAANPKIQYAVGRSFYRQGDMGKAKAYLDEVPPGNAWFGRARYLLGSIAVRAKDLDSALVHFREVLDETHAATADAAVVDYARLAEARVLYEKGEFLDAAVVYSLVSRAEDRFADRLYETVWTFVQLEDWDAALRSVEMFALAFPEHAYTAQLRLLSAHLLVARKDHDGAAEGYERVRRDYEPLRTRLGELAREPQRAAEFYGRALTFGAEEAELEGVPTYAVAMLLAEDEVQRAVDNGQEVANELADVAVSESLVRELRLVLDHRAGLTSFEQMRFELVEAQTMALAERLRLLGAEAEFRRTPRGPSWESASIQVKATLDRISAARRDLEAYERSVGELQIRANELSSDVASLESDLATVRVATQMGATGLDPSTIEQELARAQAALLVAEGAVGSNAIPSSVLAVMNAGVDPELDRAVDGLVADAARARTATDPEGKRIDGFHNALDQTEARLQAMAGNIGNVESSKLSLVRAQLEREAADVLVQRNDVARLESRSRTVGAALTLEGFKSLEAFFEDALLRADTGLVDVRWSQLMTTQEAIEGALKQRNELVADLERRFQLIRTRATE